MLRIPNLEEIQSKLLEVLTLIDRYAARNPAFLNGVLSWFGEIEGVLQRNRLVIVSEIASMRGTIISAQRGQSLAQTDHPGRVATRRAAEAAAAQMMRSAVDVITKRLDRDIILINKAEESTYELVIVGRQLKIIPADAGTSSSSASLRLLWDELTANEVTGKYTTYIRTIVGRGDALILLDRVLGK